MKLYQVKPARFAATTVRKYDVSVTANMPTAIAISQGLLYGYNAGNAILATNAAGAYYAALGFAVSDVTLTQAGQGVQAALASRGVIDFATGDIEGGSLTAGGTVYLHTGGKVTTTRPTTNGTLLQVVGVALSTTRVLVSIEPASLKVQTAGDSNVGAL